MFSLNNQPFEQYVLTEIYHELSNNASKGVDQLEVLTINKGVQHPSCVPTKEQMNTIYYGTQLIKSRLDISKPYNINDGMVDKYKELKNKEYLLVGWIMNRILFCGKDSEIKVDKICELVPGATEIDSALGI